MRENKVHNIEVHVAGICFADDKVLILKRSPSRSLYPNLWECGGGQVERGESLEEAVTRQMKEEAGVLVKPLKVLGTYFIDSEKIPGVRFLCQIQSYVNGKEPEISDEHTEWKLQDVDRIDELEFIPGLKDDIRNAYSSIKASA